VGMVFDRVFHYRIFAVTVFEMGFSLIAYSVTASLQ
jgi:hypothetical protein